jgi:hypothetical protein
MRAANGGKSEAEYVAMLVTIHVLGVDVYRRLQEEELQSFVIPGQELDIGNKAP